ncbi:V-type ATP synthase subunit I [Enterococcus xiangfangensis]|uniref:V-type ATP synthase subunit I n=1 Tax=Enterococcus xiangfangensis TaxID=1296537 RepID=A0ABU3F9Y1_9ENTE|nr:V-type ATP synthase subunit I [Enterococcus xiangfangensis]MDT2759478.1 V-type ATP synthase subunit I [Enterococcus xiangfangensis]
MAVSKMSKLTLIAQQGYSEQILSAIQGFQGVEIRDLFQQTVSNEWVEEYFEEAAPLPSQDGLSKIDQQLEEIAHAIQFIEHHGSSREKGMHLKRQQATLKTLEEKFDESALLAELTSIQELEQRFTEMNEKQRVLHERESLLQKWQALDFLAEDFSLRSANYFLGTVDASVWELLEQQIKERQIYYELIYSDEQLVNFSLVYLRKEASIIQELIHQFSVITFTYKEKELPKVELAAIQQVLLESVEEQKRLARLIGQKKISIESLEMAEEVLLAYKNRWMIHDRFIKDDKVFLLQGWLETASFNRFEAFINDLIGQENLYLEIEEPTEVEIAEEIPTKLKNNAVVKPFEMLTEMYSLPKYHEIDPTPWFMPFYFVFFGMMVADAGYGALMLLATTLALRTVLPRGMERFMHFFQILAVPTIMWGLIYNSFFGYSLGYPPILSTSDDVISILILSIIFGVIQIFIGLGLAAKENIKAKNYLGAVSDGFAWQGIMVGAIVGGLGKMLLNSQPLFMVGVVLAIVSALLIILTPMLQSKSKIKGLAKGAYNLYGITSYIGDLVSYTRLMALGISGGSIAAAFNMLVGYMPPIARFSVGILLMVALHGLNIFLSLLSAYVHGARLQYVEFFGKFYEGGGRAFRPLKTEEKYVNIEQEK